MQTLNRVILGGAVATAFLGEHMNDLGTTRHGRGVAERFFKSGGVVAVEGTRIANAECFEERGRFECFANGGLGCIEPRLRNVANDGKIGQQLFKFCLPAHVHRVVSNLDEAVA